VQMGQRIRDRRKELGPGDTVRFRGPSLQHLAARRDETLRIIPVITLHVGTLHVGALHVARCSGGASNVQRSTCNLQPVNRQSSIARRHQG